MPTVLPKRQIYLAAVVLVLLILAALIYFLQTRNFERTNPALVQGEIEPLELSQESLRALSPGPNAKPLELSPESLKALTPGPNAEPLELSPESLKALTPGSRYVIFE